MIKALLTGHSRGLGAAIADALLSRGIPLLALARSGNPQLCSTRPDLLQEASLDLSDTPSLETWLHTPALSDFFADAETALLINNAGLLQPVGLVGEADATAITRAVAVNVTAPLLLTNAFVAATRRCADRRVVHISSGAARSPYAGWSVYCATKAALDHQARAMAAEHLPGPRRNWRAGKRRNRQAQHHAADGAGSTIRRSHARRHQRRDPEVGAMRQGGDKPQRYQTAEARRQRAGEISQGKDPHQDKQQNAP